MALYRKSNNKYTQHHFTDILIEHSSLKTTLMPFGLLSIRITGAWISEDQL